MNDGRQNQPTKRLELARRAAALKTLTGLDCTETDAVLSSGSKYGKLQMTTFRASACSDVTAPFKIAVRGPALDACAPSDKDAAQSLSQMSIAICSALAQDRTTADVKVIGHTDAVLFNASYPCLNRDGTKVANSDGTPLRTNRDLGQARAASVIQELVAQCPGIQTAPPQNAEHPLSSCGAEQSSCEQDRYVEIVLPSLGSMLNQKCEPKL